MPMNKQLFSLLSLILISACSKIPSMNDLCQLYPQVCADFTADSWCKAERKNTVYFHHLNNIEKQDKHQYDGLIALEDYRDCLNIAAKIEHINFKEKTTARINNKNKTIEYIENISNQTADTNEPYMLYYHWSRYLNKNALNKFIALEHAGELESPELQFFLATYYIKIDRQKTLGHLFHALELYQAGEQINVEIIKSIVSIFTDKKEYKQAYIWLKVLQEYNLLESSSSTESLNNYAMMYQLNQQFLDKVALATLEKINNGEFLAPKF